VTNLEHVGDPWMIARELTRLTGIAIQMVHDGQRQYLVQWTDGPTLDCMRHLAITQLCGSRYPDLQAGMLTYVRGHSVHAFAARASAAQRNGALARLSGRVCLKVTGSAPC